MWYRKTLQVKLLLYYYTYSLSACLYKQLCNIVYYSSFHNRLTSNKYKKTGKFTRHEHSNFTTHNATCY